MNTSLTEMFQWLSWSSDAHPDYRTVIETMSGSDDHLSKRVDEEMYSSFDHIDTYISKDIVMFHCFVINEMLLNKKFKNAWLRSFSSKLFNQISLWSVWNPFQILRIIRFVVGHFDRNSEFTLRVFNKVISFKDLSDKSTLNLIVKKKTLAVVTSKYIKRL